ncbi:hypothetical protein G7054_g8991 [Neopestalotiopsis clavispora]|nr:hypothetical protein G7054_g8991 [Neopestalotiopsis clavispora]
MTIVTVSDAFSNSYSQLDKYPLRLVLRDTYGLSKLKLVRNRIKERAQDLFVEDPTIPVAIKDVHRDGTAEKVNLYGDAEIQEWIGDTSDVDSLIATKKDPRCRFVFLLSDSVTSPLSISAKSASRLMTYHQVSPNFFDFLDVYGSITADNRELRFSGFRSELYLTNPEPGLIMPELGRSGRHFQINYNLKTVAFKEKIEDSGPVSSLWKIRQAAIHHQFDVGSGVQLWIYGDPHAALKDRVAEIVSDQRNHKEKFDTMCSSFKSSLKVHLQSARWSTEGWRQYILSLEDTVQKLTSHFILMNENRQSQLQTDDLIPVYEYEDKINECIMTLESNADNVASLSMFYTSLVRHDEFPERQYCEKETQAFASQLSELIYDLKMQTRRARVLTKIMADRKAMFIQLLQAQAAERQEQLSTTMWRQAEQTSYEAVAMRVITVITLLYLPPTFVSTLFSTDIVKYQGDDGDFNHDKFSSLALQRFIEVSLPLMLLTFAAAFGWVWYERVEGKKKAERLEKELPGVFGKLKS